MRRVSSCPSTLNNNLTCTTILLGLWHSPARSTYSMFICICCQECTPVPIDGMQTQSNRQSHFVIYFKYPTVCGCISEAVAVHPAPHAQQGHTLLRMLSRGTNSFQQQQHLPGQGTLFHELFRHSAALCMQRLNHHGRFSATVQLYIRMQRGCSCPAIAHTDLLTLFRRPLYIQKQLANWTSFDH